MEYRLYTRTARSGAASHKTNEDHYLFTEYVFMKDRKVRVMVVADGMGGLEDGYQASRNAVLGFLNGLHAQLAEQYLDEDSENYSLEYDRNTLAYAMMMAMRSANRMVCEEADPLRQTGTTLSAVCVVDSYAVIANVGDSPVYFYRRANRELKLVSALQTKAEQDVLSGKYQRDSELYRANSNILLSSLGEYSELNDEDICINALGNLQDGDKILLGSDGAFGYMTLQEIRSWIEEYEGDGEGFFLNNLFGRSRQDKEDDQTAMLYIVDGRSESSYTEEE